MPETLSLLDLADERFVSLTTFRRSGEPVATPVWIARDGDALVVTTPASSGKIKRLRNSPRVELRPCNRFGRVADDAPSVRAHAAIVEGSEEGERLDPAFIGKYGLEYRIMMGVEKLTSRRSGGRVILRVTPATT